MTQNLSETDYVPYAYFNAQRDSDLKNAGYTPTRYGWKRPDKTATAPLPQLDASNSKELHCEKLGGVCWDEVEKQWVSCYHVEENGRISADSLYPKRAAETHHTQENVPWPEAATMIAQLSSAAGRLFLTDCVVTEMSGFFVDPDHFLTCAHFSPGNGIEDQMKEPNSKLARVSIFRVPSKTESPHFHLIFRDEDKDFALFARNPMEGKDVGQSQIHVDRLVNASLSSFPDVFAERRIFTIGYNSDCKQECFAETLESVKKSLESEQQAELLDRERGSSSPGFSSVLLPGMKSMTIGTLNKSPRQGTSTLKPHQWEHQTSGWYGISGAPIAFMDRPGLQSNLYILGLFGGGDWGNNCNQMNTFDSDILERIKQYLQPTLASQGQAQA